MNHEPLSNLQCSFEHRGKRYLLRKGQSADLDSILPIYNRAYDMWREAGFKKRDKTKQELADFLLPDGFVVEEQRASGAGMVGGMVCIRELSPRVENGQILLDRADITNRGTLEGGFVPPSDGQSAYFYGLSVDPARAREGLGAKLIEALEKIALDRRYEHCYLETGLETWLVKWYESLRFRVIARQAIEGRGIHTVILYRPLKVQSERS